MARMARVQEKEEKKKVVAKGKAAPAKDETPEKDGEGAPDTPLPLLDLNDAGVKKMIKAAKKRGYVTIDQINQVMPSGEVSSDQIEDIYAMLNEMGINVVESEEREESETPTPSTSEAANEEEADKEEEEEEETRSGNIDEAELTRTFFLIHIDRFKKFKQ